MITRWRVEAEAENDETMEDHLESFTQAVFGHLRDVQPEDQWECTDEFTTPIRSAWVSGEAVIYGRRVFRVMERA